MVDLDQPVSRLAHPLRPLAFIALASRGGFLYPLVQASSPGTALVADHHPWRRENPCGPTAPCACEWSLDCSQASCPTCLCFAQNVAPCISACVPHSSPPVPTLHSVSLFSLFSFWGVFLCLVLGFSSLFVVGCFGVSVGYPPQALAPGRVTLRCPCPFTGTFKAHGDPYYG
jgi:hypothetical protein